MSDWFVLWDISFMVSTTAIGLATIYFTDGPLAARQKFPVSAIIGAIVLVALLAARGDSSTHYGFLFLGGVVIAIWAWHFRGGRAQVRLAMGSRRFRVLMVVYVVSVIASTALVDLLTRPGV